MIRKILRKRNKRKRNIFVEPDEIFLDSKNIQNFDRQQFEGRIEKPISKKTITFLGIFFVLCGVLFLSRLGYLQIEKGQTYLQRSENNTLDEQIIFADRGLVYDRNKVPLIWNQKNSDGTQTTDDFSQRVYLTPGFSHVLGYVSYPAKDKSGNYWQGEYIGKDGIEEEYNDTLQGVNGTKIVEKDAQGKVQSENVVNIPKQGTDLTLTIDSRLQSKMFSFIQSLSADKTFSGGAGVIMNVQTGEMIASVSYPEYDSNILSSGKDVQTIENYLTDSRNVFLNRPISGLYTPGSVVKPYMAIGALNEGVITPDKQILSTGSISIPNPYAPGEESIFKDWRANGWMDMMHGIAYSSDVYFYEIGGGYQSQPGLGITNIGKYAKLFGIAQKTGIDLPKEVAGVIPSPEWKAENFPGDPWRLGDTYHTVIGQYGFQVTPIQMVRAVAAMANYGTLLTPHFILGDTQKENETTTINLPKADFDVVHQGMRDSVLIGTSSALNVPYVEVASKTGTAQLGVSKNKINSWVMGFFPFDHPKYAFVVMMEAGPASNLIGAPFIMREMLDWMHTNTPEYFN